MKGIVNTPNLDLKPKFALDSTHDKAPFLFAHKLVDVVGPASAVMGKIVHTVTHNVELLSTLVQLPCSPCAPAFLIRRVCLCRIGLVLRSR